MKPFRFALALAAVASVAAFSLPAGAQVNPRAQNRPRPNQRRAAPKNYFADLKELADLLSTRYGARIVVDPALFVIAKPTPPDEKAAITAALDAIVGPLKIAAWRRVYLSQNQTNPLPAPEKLAASIRSLVQVEQTGLVLENPASRRATYLKNFEVPADFAGALTADQFDPKGIYVIFATTLDPLATRSQEEVFMDLQKQQMDMMMQMDPDSLAQAMGKSMQLWNNLDPDTRTQMMGTMMKAGMQMFQNMSPADRQALMGQMMQNAQAIFGSLNGGGAPPKP